MFLQVVQFIGGEQKSNVLALISVILTVFFTYVTNREADLRQRAADRLEAAEQRAADRSEAAEQRTADREAFLAAIGSLERKMSDDRLKAERDRTADRLEVLRAISGLEIRIADHRAEYLMIAGRAGGGPRKAPIVGDAPGPDRDGDADASAA